MPQLDVSTYSSQIFWLVVTFGVLYFLLWKIALPKVAEVLSQRQSKIDQDLASAVNLKQEAEKILADYEARLATAKSEAQALMKQAGDEVSAASVKANDALTAKLEKKMQEAEKRISGAKADAMANIMEMAGETVAAASTKLVGAELSDKEIQDAIKSSLEERG
jgi:F-type H+-transporting ATPase subunit b